MRVAFEGVVYEPDGHPAAGAVLVTSAGGKAVAEQDGSFRIETEVPIEAESVQLTAIGRGGAKRIASASVHLRGGAGTVPAGSLWLGQGACQPGWLPTFGHHPGVDNTVLAMTVFDDGNGPALYAGGQFTYAGGARAEHIARWDGRSWQPLGNGLSLGVVRALAVYDDGSGPALYAGGDFSPGHVAKWNGVSWSGLGTGIGSSMTHSVHALVVYDDGSGPALYAGGQFDSAGGVPTSGLAKWDGVQWTSLGSGVSGASSTPGVHALTVYDDGSGTALYAGGQFGSVSGVTAVGVAKWNGVAWAKLGSGQSQRVNALLVHDDGHGPKLYAGRVGGLSRWTGTQWQVVGSVSGGAPAAISTLATWDDGSGPALYAGGTFTVAGGTAASSIARWNGSSWSALANGTSGGGIRALAAFDSGSGVELHAGGEFTSAGSVLASFLAKWNGASWKAVGDGLDGWVHALEIFDDGGGPALHAAGAFRLAGGSPVNSIVKWTGSGWEALGDGITDGSNNEVYALTVFDDGSGSALYVGGRFGQAGGIAASNVARWNGSTWSAVGSGLGQAGHAVFALTVFDDGSGARLFAGGNFQTQDGGRGVARWTGSSWVGLGSGVDGSLDPFVYPSVSALAVHDDGSGPALLAGGTFLTAGGTAARNIARWNGTSWSALGGGTSDTVLALTSHDEGSGPALYAGGTFSSAGGISAGGIARWDGASWSSVGGGTNGFVRALTAFDDGCGPALCAGGYFTLAGGSAASSIAKWDGTSWTALGSGMAGVAALQASDGAGAALHAGGDTWALETGDSYLARWSFDTSAPTLSCPPPVYRFDLFGTPPGEIVTFEVTAEDDRDPAPTITCVPASGSLFPAGRTLVTCTATDASGNRTSCEFPVIVKLGVRSR